MLLPYRRFSQNNEHKLHSVVSVWISAPKPLKHKSEIISPHYRTPPDYCSAKWFYHVLMYSHFLLSCQESYPYFHLEN